MGSPPTTLQTCTKAYGQVKCAAGTALSELECRAYGDDTGGLYFVSAWLTTAYPVGCWEYSSGGQVYYNTNAYYYNFVSYLSAPICKSASGNPTCMVEGGVLVGGMRWYTSAGSSAPSCNSVCTAAGKTCNAASIRSVTLESSCATQVAVLTGYGLSYGGCVQCSPSDSTNTYCFPGRAGGSSMYYHTSFAAGGFNCATVPDSSTNPSICPCT